MLSTGLRRGEALGLHWKDFDPTTGVLVVRRSLKREDGALIVADTKTAKSRRAVNVPTQMIAALQAHKARQAKEKLSLGRAWLNSGFIFTTSIGTPIDPRNLNLSFGLSAMTLASVTGTRTNSDTLPQVYARPGRQIAGCKRRSRPCLHSYDLRRIWPHPRT